MEIVERWEPVILDAQRIGLVFHHDSFTEDTGRQLDAHSFQFVHAFGSNSSTQEATFGAPIFVDTHFFEFEDVLHYDGVVFHAADFSDGCDLSRATL